MGNGFWIIIADGFGSGLELLNGHLYDEGGRNWWPCRKQESDDDKAILEAEIIERFDLGRFHFARIVFN